jgi:TonB family protein
MNIRPLSVFSIAAALSVTALSPLSAAIENARPLSRIVPAYSPDLRMSRIEGEVVVSFIITAKGNVLNPTVVSSTDRLLDGPTLAAVRKWKFTPAMDGGVAVAEKAVIPVAFVIPDLHSHAAARLVTVKSSVASAPKVPASAD